MAAPAAVCAEDLAVLPLFADIDIAELAALQLRWELVSPARGETVFRRGDAGDALYVVLSGQVAMEIAGDLLGLCGPGDWFGEMALLGPGTRSADARIVIDATLLRIDRDGWASLGARAPRVFARVCERLAAHLRRSNESRAARRRVVACVDSADWLPALVSAIRRQFPERALHVLARDGDDVSDDPARAVGRREDRERLARTVTRVVAADAVVLLATADGDGVADHVLRRTGAATWAYAGAGTNGTAVTVRGRGHRETVDRVARRVMGGTVGIALGAGGAYGYAHFGLLEVLERAGIPIDVVAGSSMGAIAGAVAAVGMPAARAVAYATEIAARYRGIVLRDIDLRGRTLLTGTTVQRVLSDISELRDVTFDELELPFEAVAMDVASGAQVVLGEGAVLEAIRPSFAMPGIFPVCVRDGRSLVDGAMVNPVPVDRARALGGDVIIGVQPIPPLQENGGSPLDVALGRTRRALDWIPFGAVRHGVDTLAVSVRSFQALWYRLATAMVRAADVTIAPDLRDFWFLQFGAAAPIIAAGRAHAETMIPQIRAVLRTRVGLHTGPTA